MELKKSYTGFVVWMIVFTAGLMSFALLPTEDGGLLTRGIMNWTTAAMAYLTWHVWRTEQIYWYTGVSYEEAEAAGSERRKRYAWRHFRIFGGFALGMLAFSCAMHLLGLPWWVDILVGGVGLCAAAFCTMPIKL